MIDSEEAFRRVVKKCLFENFNELKNKNKKKQTNI